MCKSLIFTEFSNIANQIAVKKSFRKQWPNGLYGIARTLNSASQPVKKRRALFSSVDSPSQGKRFLVQLVLFLISADNGDPVARGKAPFLCSFLDVEFEISKFRRDLLLYFLSLVEFDFWGKLFAFEGNVEFTKPPLLFNLKKNQFSTLYGETSIMQTSY